MQRLNHLNNHFEGAETADKKNSLSVVDNRTGNNYNFIKSN